ncbi:MAG TPA: hypothetical protein VIX37_14865 [Candidatus Sulfotelmatobacter sp.]
MKIYHNIEQNRKVKFVDDVLAVILSTGFRDGFENAVWFSDAPIICQENGFTGVVVEVPGTVDLTIYKQSGDALLDEGFTTYAIPANVVNAWPREQAWA